MSPEQYRRANNNSFNVCIVILISGVLITISKFMQNGATISNLGILVGVLVGNAMIMTGKFRHAEEKLGSILIMGGSTVFYFFLLIFEDNIIFFAFGLPILICSIIYLNVRLCKAGIGAIIISYIITCIKYYVVNGSLDLMHGLAFLTLGLAFIACLATVTLLTKFNDENNDRITKDAEKSLETGNNMASIANKITELFNNSQENMQDLQQIIEAQHRGMQEIATSMETTAQSAVTQAERVQQIQEETATTEQHRKDMTQASENTQNAVREGVAVIDNLKEKSAAVADQSQVTVDATQAVINKVSDVQKIVGTIMSISKQTNLLALNASIEAARAGEAGKGFAVVANDVRELAAQTNTASTEITNIINELNEDVQKAMASIDDTVASVSEQNEMIASVGENFDSINENVSDMLSRFTEIGEGMKSIAASTTEINDSISNLSATSQEVASLSNEGVRESDEAVAKFDEFKEILLQIFQQANKLTDMQQDN